MPFIFKRKFCQMDLYLHILVLRMIYQLAIRLYRKLNVFFVFFLSSRFCNIFFWNKHLLSKWIKLKDLRSTFTFTKRLYFYVAVVHLPWIWRFVCPSQSLNEHFYTVQYDMKYDIIRPLNVIDLLEKTPQFLLLVRTQRKEVLFCWGLLYAEMSC